jgi:hypothetical protein
MLIRMKEGLFVPDLSQLESGKNAWADTEWASDQG